MHSIPVILFSSFVLLSSCAPSKEIVKTASGVLAPGLQDALQTATDAAKVLSGSLQEIKKDIEERTGNIVEGAQKVREGKEQMEKGVRGE